MVALTTPSALGVSRLVRLTSAVRQSTALAGCKNRQLQARELNTAARIVESSTVTSALNQQAVNCAATSSLEEENALPKESRAHSLTPRKMPPNKNRFVASKTLALFIILIAAAVSPIHSACCAAMTALKPVFRNRLANAQAAQSCVVHARFAAISSVVNVQQLMDARTASLRTLVFLRMPAKLEMFANVVSTLGPQRLTIALACLKIREAIQLFVKQRVKNQLIQ